MSEKPTESEMQKKREALKKILLEALKTNPEGFLNSLEQNVPLLADQLLVDLYTLLPISVLRQHLPAIREISSSFGDTIEEILDRRQKKMHRRTLRNKPE